MLGEDTDNCKLDVLEAQTTALTGSSGDMRLNSNSAGETTPLHFTIPVSSQVTVRDLYPFPSRPLEGTWALC